MPYERRWVSEVPASPKVSSSFSRLVFRQASRRKGLTRCCSRMSIAPDAPAKIARDRVSFGVSPRSPSAMRACRSVAQALVGRGADHFDRLAAKHGSLSTPGGTVTVQWAIDATTTEPTINVHWQEKGGPVIAPPEAKRIRHCFPRTSCGYLRSPTSIRLFARGLLVRSESSSRRTANSRMKSAMGQLPTFRKVPQADIDPISYARIQAGSDHPPVTPIANRTNVLEVVLEEVCRLHHRNQKAQWRRRGFVSAQPESVVSSLLSKNGSPEHKQRISVLALAYRAIWSRVRRLRSRETKPRCYTKP